MNNNLKFGAKVRYFLVVRNFFCKSAQIIFFTTYNAMKNDPYVEMKNSLLPVAIGIGYNFVF